MPKQPFKISREGEPLLDIVSYGRGGPRENGRTLTSEQLEQVRRTVQRVPEVMVKVLPRASSDLKAAGKHVDYISRKGELALETDDAGLQHASGAALLEEWDLDIDDVRRQLTLSAANGRKPPKLIHKLMLSMPPGTPSDKVVAAVRNFAREEFWGIHRYAYALHTDEDHPHVHLILKATNESGDRLNIKKSTLRHWRGEFAKHLRQLGIAANATERAVRGNARKSFKDGIYRAALRGESFHVRNRVEAAAAATESIGWPRRLDSALAETRRKVVHGWLEMASHMSSRDQGDVARAIVRFVRGLPPAITDLESIASELARPVHEPPARTRI